MTSHHIKVLTKYEYTFPYHHLAADTALVGPLARVIIHVFHQVELVNKSLSTYSTHMRSLKSVLLHFVSVEVPVILSLVKLVNTITTNLFWLN